MIKNSEVISLFSDILKPHIQGEGGLKLLALKEFLEKHNISYEYDGKIGLIINKQDNPRLVCVSHMDLITTFSRGAAEGKTFLVKGDLIGGALDNTITNAASLISYLHLLKEGVTDIELLLSEGEEVGLVGMRNYIKTYNQKSKKTFFVNLDVTNDGWGKDVSIEFDKPNFDLIKQFQEIGKGFDLYFTPNRFCDDTDAILDADCNGLSICLPTANIIHSYNSCATLKSLENYSNYLLKILMELKPPKDFNKKAISKSEFAKALEVKKFKELKIDSSNTADYIEEVIGFADKSHHQDILVELIANGTEFYPSDYSDSRSWKDLIENLKECGYLEEFGGMCKFVEP
jgi:hypothetical protein